MTIFCYLNSYTFHITLYDLAFLGAIFIGVTFALQLWFTKFTNRSANRFLALAVVTMVVWMVQLLFVDIKLDAYLPHWHWMPMQFLLALGPLLYFYVLKITWPQNHFRWKDLLHFSPVILELVSFALETGESVRTGAPTYATHAFQVLNPVLQLLIFISIITYLYKCNKLIWNFYHRLQPVLMDRPLIEFRWLRRLLAATAVLWCLWLVFAAIHYVAYRSQPSLQVYYPFYIFFVVIIIWTAAAAFLKPQAALVAQLPAPSKPPVPAEVRAKGAWIKRAMEANRYYEDPELSLATLAEKLSMSPHELSKVINAVFKKGFNDFINEYRVADAARKMQDSAYDNMTLLGIAYEAGFNSKATFIRAFKQFTGKTPAEYKQEQEKQVATYHLQPHLHRAGIISGYQTHKGLDVKLNRKYMFSNYVKIAWRNLTRNKASSFINIGGLAVGMAVSMLISLWIWDELSFNKYHRNYGSIAQVMQNETFNGVVNTGGTISLPLDAALRKDYGQYFKHIVLTGWEQQHTINFEDKNLSFTGNFMGQDAPGMFSLRMLAGNSNGLKDPSSLLLSAPAAKALFGNETAVGKLIKLDNKDVFNVAGVYEDLPQNTTLHNLAFIGSFDYYIHSPGNERSLTDWGDNSLVMYVQVADNADMAAVSAKIRDIKLNQMSPEDKKFKPAIFLQPMAKWHLYSEFKNGVNTGGAISYVRLFGIIGFFVLLLACINFMNLSTARSEKRAKEVGIRKAVGSLKGDLVQQFYWESFLIALASFIVSLVLAWLALPWFNAIAGKQISMLWGSPLFWVAGLGFTLFTAIIAGSYPALYLSSFNPVKVLKGTFKAGPRAALPRKVLVVAQFCVSTILIIGTIVIFKQVQFAKNRPVGYNRAGLLDIQVTNDDLHNHFDAFKSALLSSGTVLSVAESSSATTGVNNNRGDISWAGRNPWQADFFGSIRVTPEYGKTIGWQFTQGRDFIPGNTGDSLSVVLNEAAAKYIGFKEPVGKTLKVGKRDLTIVGVVKNMVMESPYEPAKPTLFYFGRPTFDDVLIRINPNTGIQAALEKIAAACKTYSPSVPFTYRFTDDEYAKKFAAEERTGSLAGTFSALAIFICCLGLFGMAAFFAEQRVKEIGLRKVLGATVLNVWALLSHEFVKLIVISWLIAVPVAYGLMYSWLQHYTYRTSLSWWIFAATAAGVLLITLLTVSYQGLKAAFANPVKSLRSE